VELTVPGDKSISQRALIFAALAEGTSRLRGLLAGADPRSTASVLRQLGASIPPLPRDGAPLQVEGLGLRGLDPGGKSLDCGNSGTAARLMMGVLAGQAGVATLTGDDSLRGRPMRRVTGPLTLMGARFEELEETDCLPIRVRGGALGPLEHASPVASAQVKSALLLAGLVGGASVVVTEPARSRDHTERLLAVVGAPPVCRQTELGWQVRSMDPPGAIDPLDLTVPGDFSSAAFFLVLGLLGGAGSRLTMRHVGLNPTRTGLLRVLRRMGASVDVTDPWSAGAGEPAGTLSVAPSGLAGTQVGSDEVPGLIDEIPILAVAAARAEGATRVTGAHELRLKETDRIRALVENLTAVGVRAEELDDGFEIEGSDRPLAGRVRAFGDHRIAMAFQVLGALPGNRIELDDPAVAGVSFPGFAAVLSQVGAHARSGGSVGGADVGEGAHVSRARDVRDEAHARAGVESRAPVVTIDGPAGSGKSTTAREVARRLGFRHLDSGALYRAITFALLERDIRPQSWEDLTPTDLARFEIDLVPEADGFELRLEGRRLDSELRTPEVTAHVSKVASLPAVRSWLLEHQHSAGRLGGLVADGRDMGTVVFPDAELKVFLTADLEERARRRLRQDTGREPDADSVSREASRIQRRDRLDSERQLSPLRRPDDAAVLDTTRLTEPEQVDRIVALVRALGSSGGG
jgi:3-phosphoshikimate 1-carboxyvinyltransferase